VKGFDGSGLSGSHALFEFGPGLFDRIEVRRVGRQVEQRCTASLDPVAYALDLVGAEVVHDYHVARPQLRAKHVVQVSQEDLAVGGGFDGHRGQHAVVVHRTQDGQHLPVAARHGIVDPFAARRPCIDAGHLRRDTTFVHVDQVFDRDTADLREELFAPPAVDFGVPLGGVERLFFSTRPSRFNVRHSCAIEMRWPA
jgi:hypothetical protein